MAGEVRYRGPPTLQGNPNATPRVTVVRLPGRLVLGLQVDMALLAVQCSKICGIMAAFLPSRASPLEADFGAITMSKAGWCLKRSRHCGGALLMSLVELKKLRNMPAGLPAQVV